MNSEAKKMKQTRTVINRFTEHNHYTKKFTVCKGKNNKYYLLEYLVTHIKIIP